jgi:2-polyprenyl-3-methyl-5-hydroxy-6-metoxy-1,4-benzoquinol methylase
MPNTTLSYYDENAERIVDEYISTDIDFLQNHMDTFFSDLRGILSYTGGTIFEIGTGSGRDMKFLLRNGYYVVGFDGSKEMIAQCKIHYPELDARIIHCELPKEFPDFYGKADAMYSIATLMHFNREELHQIMTWVNEKTKDKAKLFFSISEPRDNADERYFNDLVKADYLELFESHNFYAGDVVENIDNRGIMWNSYMLEKR